MPEKRDTRQYRGAHLKSRDISLSQSELILTFQAPSIDGTRRKQATVHLDRYAIRDVLKAVNMYKRQMSEHFAEQAASVQRNCTEQGE